MMKEKYIILLIIIIFGWFYWFQWRPTEIRKECAEVSMKNYSESFSQRDSDPSLTGDLLNDGKIPVSAIERLNENRETNYVNCLRIEGLNK